MNRHHAQPRRRRGFTMAELLIVVAIIAVLVAIAIPVFASQLEKSREATDLYNVRVAYAELKTALITDGADALMFNSPIGSGMSAPLTVPLKQQVAGWQGLADDASIGEVPRSEWRGGEPQLNGICKIYYDFTEDKVIIDWGGTDGASGDGGDTGGTGESGGSGGSTIAEGTKTTIRTAIMAHFQSEGDKQHQFTISVVDGRISIEGQTGNPHDSVTIQEIMAVLRTVEGVTIDGDGRMRIGEQYVTDDIHVHYTPGQGHGGH